MLVELSVENLAVVEKVRVRFHGGLNVLSGETGSGKSIVVDALSLLFGGRASGDMVRSGADRMRVSGIFDLGDSSARLRAFLDDSGVETEDRELILEREIAASNGKSRAYAGGKPVTAAFLRELSQHLGSIHGQHDQQGLSSPEAQRELLDAISPGAQKLLPEVARLYSAFRATAHELDDLDRGEQEKLRMADLWSFQKKEIEAADLSPGEDTRLEAERKLLRNVTRLEESAAQAFALLYDAPESAIVQAKQALKKIEDLARIDDSMQAVADTLRPAIFSLDDASQTLADYLGKLEADPARLEIVESRLAAIEKLKRKYGDSLDDVLAFLATVTAQLDAVETAGERRAALQKEKDRLAAAYTAAAESLREKRKDGARQLVKKVEAELASLAMQRTRFVVSIEPASDWSSHGLDDIEFLISANVGEDPKPLDKVASGGELSRVSLALKTIAAGSRQRDEAARTMVFDEVDAGVSGKAAEAVGRKLRRIAEHDQVLCVTHLPQVASFAESHFSVAKHASRNRTFTTIEELDHDGRTKEIGRMLSGERLTDEALRQAEQLIQFATAKA